MQTHALIFIKDLAIIMLTAGFTTIMCHRIKQPIVLGYIIAGIIIGTHTPPFSLITDETTIKTLAELGVIFLMFALGLEFNLYKLSKVGKIAVVTAILEILLMVWLGYMMGKLFGWTHINAIFLGAILSISSTTIIVKAFNELGLAKESFAQIVFGILIIEDIFAILILALLSSIATTGTLHVKDIALTTIELSSFLAVALILGILLVPKLLTYVSRFKNNEVLLITVLGLCFGFCLLVSKLNYSVALGAFIIGAIIAESNQLTKIERLINPLRDMFSAIFFVSVGLLFDPKIFISYFWPIVIITVVIIIGKIISCSLGVFITGQNGKTAVRVGMSLAQIGEFSFIIASLGITLQVTGNFLYSIAVCVSIITTLLTPYLIKYSDSFTNFITQNMPKNITNTFAMYAEWMQNINPSEDQLNLQNSIKRGIFQIILNILIVIAIFISGNYLAKTEFGIALIKIANPYILNSLIWAIALMLSLPFLIAAFRKVKALSMIYAELSIKEKADNRLTFKIRRIISDIIPIIFIFITMLLIFLLSTSILPPVEWLFLILIFTGVLIFFIYPWIVKLHTKLQISLMEALHKENKKKRDKPQK